MTALNFGYAADLARARRTLLGRPAAEVREPERPAPHQAPAPEVPAPPVPPPPAPERGPTVAELQQRIGEAIQLIREEVEEPTAKLLIGVLAGRAS